MHSKNNKDCTLIDRFSLLEKILMRIALYGFIIIGAYAIFSTSIVWGTIYSAFVIFGTAVVASYLFCSHCPYPYKYRECFFFPAGIIRLFSRFRSEPMNIMEKAGALGWFAGLIVIPQFWLISQICIITGGILSLFMALFHIQFYKLFDWKKDFEKISTINQKIFYTIHLALLLLFFIFSFISFAYTNELSQCSGLTCGVTLGYSLFWLWRTIWQIIYFHPTKNQKAGKMVFLHYLMTIVFGILFLVYLVPFILDII